MLNLTFATHDTCAICFTLLLMIMPHKRQTLLPRPDSCYRPFLKRWQSYQGSFNLNSGSYISRTLVIPVKILSVDKGFFIPGGQQLFGKFKSLKHCMKACAVSSNCFNGDYSPWLHRCYQHTNATACNRQSSHPQYVHFSKVPCCELS